MRWGKWQDLGWLAAILSLALIPRLFILHWRGFEIFHSDQAVIGLMGKHILEGKPMVYFYGQAYMGSLEAFMAALTFAIFGISLLSLQLAPLIFYLGFLIVNYFLFKKAFGRPIAILTNFFLALSPPYLTVLSMTALGGYPETLFFGSLVLLGLLYYSEIQPRRIAKATYEVEGVAFGIALLAGIGFWVNNLILMYFIAIGLFLFFHFLPLSFPRKRESIVRTMDPRFRGDDIKQRASRNNVIGGLFYLKNFKLPLYLKIPVIALHLYFAFFILSNLISFLIGPQENLFLKLPTPPFHVKKIKQLLLIVMMEVSALWIYKNGFKGLKALVKQNLPWLSGFLIGSSPAWLYSLLGGEGMRMIHASSMIYAKDLPHQIFDVLGIGFVREIMGIPFHHLYIWKGWESVLAWAMVPVVFFPIVSFPRKRESIVCTMDPRFRRADSPAPEDQAADSRLHNRRGDDKKRSCSFALFPIILLAVTILICLFNNLTAGRYLCPLHAVIAFFFAFSVYHLWIQNKKGIAILLLSLLVFNRVYTNVQYFQGTLVSGKDFRNGIENSIQFLKDQNIKAAYIPKDLSYMMTFFSKEEVIFAPYHAYDRYPAYREFVDHEERVAYLFPESEPFYTLFQNSLDANKIPYQKTWTMPFLIYTMNRSLKSEKGLVP